MKIQAILRFSLQMIILFSFCFGQVPRKINYQGYLKDSDGNPVTGEYQIEFLIYDQEETGTAIWNEIHSVTITDGLFNVLLGSINPLPGSTFIEESRYLALKVNEEPEMSVRKEFTSVAYAFKSGNSDSLNGYKSDDFVKVGLANAVTKEMVEDNFISSLNNVENDGGNIDLLAGSNISIDADNASNRITISANGGEVGESDNLGNHIATQNVQTNYNWISCDGDDEGIYISDNGNVSFGLNRTNLFNYYFDGDLIAEGGEYGGAFSASDNNGKAVYGYANGDSSDGVYGFSDGYLGVGVHGLATNTSESFGGYFRAEGAGDWGVGVLGDAASRSNCQNYGGYFTARGEKGIGVYGNAPNYSTQTNYGGYFQAKGEDGTGVYGKSYGENGTGVYGIAYSEDNVKNYGGYFKTNGGQGIGVYAEATDDGSGLTVGGRFITNSEYGIGVWANANNSSSGTGGYFQALGESGKGVVGYGENEGDVTNYGGYFHAEGLDGIGVFGSAHGDDGIAIYGYSENLAGKFQGDVEVTGTLSKSAGSFKIDHPLDPDNKYLQHSFVESPDMMNIYKGTVVLDNNGKATVDLPAYFEKLNKEYTYQLTCVGGYAQVYISKEISNNQFTIAGGNPGLKVCWEVSGIRNDPYAKRNRIKVVVDKKGNRGKYLVPQAYGAPETMTIGYQANRERERAEEELNKRFNQISLPDNQVGNLQQENNFPHRQNRHKTRAAQLPKRE
jgi:hypothetical protein